MNFDWDAHRQCWAAKLPGDEPRGTGPCVNDRAAMIAEGKRLEAENARLKATLRDVGRDIRREYPQWSRDIREMLGDIP